MQCKCCNCVYEIETRDDFKINWGYKPVGDRYDYNILIPEYSIVCPNCGYDQYIGFDKDDYEGINSLENCFNRIIMNRSDWKSRYKIEPRRRISE